MTTGQHQRSFVIELPLEVLHVETKEKKDQLSIRINSQLKTNAQDVANDMGLDLTTAVTMFLIKMVKTHSLPFEPESLPLDTLIALKEAEHPEKLKHYQTPKEMWGDLDVLNFSPYILF